MREILFRGQRVDKGEWVYGMPLESKFNCTYMLTKQGGLNADFIHSRYTILDSKDSIVVKTETIGQFTGLLDKNGNKVFEGDIDKSGMIVMFHNNAFQLCSLVDKKVVQAIPFWCCDNKIFDEIEIIGNIHE